MLLIVETCSVLLKPSARFLTGCAGFSLQIFPLIYITPSAAVACLSTRSPTVTFLNELVTKIDHKVGSN